MRWARTLATQVDLLCFVGGDGTAADMARAVGDTVPCLGIPAGVKITSPVFALDPEMAGWMVAHLGQDFDTVARDVTDLDEESYRDDRLEVVLKGSLVVPLNPAVQGGKVATSAETTLQPIVEQVMRDWDPEAIHIVGAGSVCRAIKSQFFGKPTLLGVDVIQGVRIIDYDLDADAIHDVVAAAHASGRTVHLWLSIIGGQGMLFGRGTQVFTPRNIRAIGWNRISVVAPPEKLLGLRALHIDTGDPVLDAGAPTHLKVIAGWNEWRLVQLRHGGKSS
jgi:predicted polyphosphate/ATP-dependent NAD kinase